MPSSDRIELNNELISREDYINQIDEAFTSQRILILTGFGKKILAQQYASCINKKLQFSTYYTKDTLEKCIELDKAFEKDLQKNFLFIFEFSLLETTHKNFIQKISKKHQNVFFMIKAVADDVSILKEIFENTKTIDVPALTKEESKHAIKHRLKSLFTLEDEDFNDSIFDEFDNNLDELLEHFKNYSSYLKSSKIIIEYLEKNKTDEPSDIINKMFDELMQLVST